MKMDDHRESDGEEFPLEHRVTMTIPKTGQSTSWEVRYRFVEIVAPDGWKTYPGCNCHDGKDGLLLADEEGRWWEQDLWGARNEQYCLDIGCYGTKEYVCHAHEPDWHGKRLEEKVFTKAEDAAAWAQAWMKNPGAALRRISRERFAHVAHAISDGFVPWEAWAHVNSWAGHARHPCIVIGETPKRYRCHMLDTCSLAGTRWKEGDIKLIPKDAISKRDEHEELHDP